MRTYELPKLNYDAVERQIRDFIRFEAKDRGVVLGLSGGVDSAAVAAISVKALGREKVLALIMPEANSSLESDTQDALSFAHMLGISFEKLDITESVNSMLKTVGRRGGNLVEGNLKARMRMAILYYWANLENRLVVGAGDKSELSVGYFTKYGDGGVDILPLGDLYKTQVRELASHLGVPENITTKKSSPRLWPDHLAEEELGVSYAELDRILHLYVDHSYDKERIISELGSDSAHKVDKVLGMVKANAHKLKPPPIAKIYGKVE